MPAESQCLSRQGAGESGGAAQDGGGGFLNKTLEELRLERKKLIEDYESKLHKAQSFYEHELDTLKRSQLFTAESLQASKEKEADLRKEFQGQEAVLRKTIGKIKDRVTDGTGQVEVSVTNVKSFK